MYPGGLKEINFKDLQAKDSTEVNQKKLKAKLFLSIQNSPFARLFQACYQRIDFVKLDWIV